MKYLTYIGNCEPSKVYDKIKALAEEKDVLNPVRVEFASIWIDSHGYEVTEEILRGSGTNNKITIVFKNSWKKDNSMAINKALSINND